LVVVVSPAVGDSNVLFPVTGVDQDAFPRELSGTFTNLCLGFLGLGLVMKGLARRFEK